MRSPWMATDALRENMDVFQQRTNGAGEIAPARCPFFCILFFGQAKKSMFNSAKKIC